MSFPRSVTVPVAKHVKKRGSLFKILPLFMRQNLRVAVSAPDLQKLAPSECAVPASPRSLKANKSVQNQTLWESSETELDLCLYSPSLSSPSGTDHDLSDTSGSEDEGRIFPDLQYKEDLESSYQSFMSQLRSKDWKSINKFLSGFLLRHSFDYMFDLWGAAHEFQNDWTVSMETLGRLVRFLMQDGKNLQLSSLFTPVTGEAMVKYPKVLRSKLKKTVQPLFKKICSTKNLALETSVELLQHDVTRKVIKIFKQADHVYYLVAGRSQTRHVQLFWSLVQLLWATNHRPTDKHINDELDFVHETQGSEFLVSLLSGLCLLDPLLLAKETESNLDLAVGALAARLDRLCWCCGGSKRDPVLMVPTMVLGRFYPFALPDMPTANSLFLLSDAILKQSPEQ